MHFAVKKYLHKQQYPGTASLCFLGQEGLIKKKTYMHQYTEFGLHYYKLLFSFQTSSRRTARVPDLQFLFTYGLVNPHVEKKYLQSLAIPG